MSTPPFDLTLQLRQHGTAVRRLAMELLRDGAAAEDAAQEAWVRAVQRPPRHEDAVGGWLATIVKLWMEVGTVTIAAGETSTVELRLPQEWEK